MKLVRVGRQLELQEEEVQGICLAEKIHDIGKSVVSRELLVKPGSLNATEWSTIKRHPTNGAVFIEPSKNLKKLQPMVRSHHEYFNGKGFPNGLIGQDIPLRARILAIVDVYSTMISGRAYRDSISSEYALEELIRCSGNQFAPEMINYMSFCIKK